VEIMTISDSATGNRAANGQAHVPAADGERAEPPESGGRDLDEHALGNVCTHGADQVYARGVR
jgi:hypothetical protein